MAYDAAKASVLQQLLQQGLSEDQAIKIAGISESDIGNYTINDVPGDPNRGQVQPSSVIAQRTDVQVMTPAETAAQFKDDANFYGDTANTTSIANAVVKSDTTTTSTETVSGGGSTTVVYTPPIATEASKQYATQADGYNSQIQAINKQLGSPRFGGDPNLTADQRAALEEQRTKLYSQ